MEDVEINNNGTDNIKTNIYYLFNYFKKNTFMIVGLIIFVLLFIGGIVGYAIALKKDEEERNLRFNRK